MIVVVVWCVAIVYGYDSYQQHKRNTPHVKKLALNEPLPPNIPPASCPEWQTQSTPTYSYPPGKKCKVLGGADLCWRAGYPDFGPPNPTYADTLDIGPISGKTQVKQPITVYFRLRDFGIGDAIVYVFGKVDWGDNTQNNLLPFAPNGVSMTHTYASRQTFVVHAMAGAQFKYSTPQVGGVSGSYEACQDNSIQVTVTP